MILGLIVFPVFALAQESVQWNSDSIDSLWANGDQMVTGSMRPVSLTEFQENTLGKGELFLQTHAGKSHCHILAVTQGQTHLVELPGDNELKILFTRLHQQVSQLEGIESDLTRVLFGELSEELEVCEKVIFSPEGIFNLAPVSLLLKDYTGISFVRVPSAAVLVALRNNAGTREPVETPKILAVGGVLKSGLEAQPEAYLELDDLDSSYAGVTVVRPNAGGAAPELAKLKGFDLIHVAAQSIGDDGNVEESSIALDPSSPAMMIRASEIYGVQLDTPLVVLARCLTAPGPELSGEGIQYLTSAFLSVGVSDVVVALWPVNEAATVFFMNAFYEGLSLGEDAAGALGFARHKCRQDPMFNEPYYWGGFVLAGMGEVQLNLKPEKESQVGSLLGLMVGVGAGVFFVLRMRR